MSSLMFSNLISTTQKILPCTITSYVRHFCSKPNDNVPTTIIPSDGPGRRLAIEEEARRELDTLTKENPEMNRLMKIYELEIDVMRQDGERVPSELRPRDWVELLKLQSVFKRKKFLSFLFGIEMKKKTKMEIRIEGQLEMEKVRAERNIQDIDVLEYGIGRNSIFRRIVDKTMSNLWKWNSLKAVMFGNKIVFDCSYDSYMTSIECKSCAKQILESYAVNRQHDFPFHIYLCNANVNGPLIKHLYRYIPTLFDNDFPMTITSDSYLDVFDKSKLVYLSSNSPKVLDKFDNDSTYIIGAMVDKGVQKPFSLTKSKQEKIQSAKLPLDKYLHFGFGSGKDLTLNQVISIMLDIQKYDWNTALKHVPNRKLFQSRLHSLEKKAQQEFFDLQKSLQFQKEDDSAFHKLKDLSDQNKNELFKKLRFESAANNDYSHASRSELRNKQS